MKKYIVSTICILLVLMGCLTLYAAEPRVVKIGAFSLYPAIFKDTDGAVKGFYVDALTDIAQRENIRLEYVYGSWSEGLERVKSGEVDLLTSVAFTPERAQFLDYAKTPLLTVWGELYVPLSSDIDGIRAVQGKKIAVMKNDFNARHFIELVKKFDITCEFIEMPGFEDVFKAVAAEKVDAGVVNSTFGIAKQKEFGLRSTGVIFNPFDIFFAVAKGKNSDLLVMLDNYLHNWRHQNNSPYNMARQKWSHGSDNAIQVIPRWLLPTFAILAFLSLCAFAFIFMLRKQVSSKTRSAVEAAEQYRLVAQELRLSEERFRLIMETVAIVPWEYNIPENRWTYVGPQVTDLLGYAPEEWTTLEWWLEIIHPEDQAWVPAYCAELTSRGEEHSMEYRLRAKDGSFVWVNDLVTVEILDGKPHIMRGIIVDITERKKNEAEKLLLEQQFQQTQKLESLGVLAGGIAHDFNNILAIIMGYCSLTKMDYEDAEKHIPEIEKAAERAAALCRQMLAYAGKASLTQSQVNSWMLVDEMVTMLKTAIKKNVTIKPELGTDIPYIMGDESQLRQVVMNLIINAADAIGDAEGEISVKLTKTEINVEQPELDHLGLIIPAGRYICFEVSDNGCGMDDETRRRIFEPFYTTKFTGRGLGMSAVLGIIKAHSGALQLESRLGYGTTFRVYLPVQLSKNESEEAQQRTASAPWQGSGTILLAEDEVQVKAIAIVLLQMLGFTVIDAANGKEALELYQQNAADITLVVTDMGMPVMSGYELFYKLKQLNPHLPIIISSGFGKGDISSKIPSEEIAGLINKPYKFEQLKEVIRRIVEGKDGENQGVSSV